MSDVLDLCVERYTRDDVDILKDVRWQIRRGEHWVVLGANGAGKSTLLSIVAGYDWPSRGHVSVLGEHYGRTDMRALKARIGWVSSALFTWLPDRQSAREVAATGIHATIGNWHALSEDDLRRADRALDQIGGSTFADKRYGILSQGERQRAMIARALVTNPDLLILDEPCAGLDPGARERLIDDVDRLCRSPTGPTLILVSHHVEEIPPAATHALLLKDGCTLAVGPLAETLTDTTLTTLYDHPCHLTTRNARYALTTGSR